VLGTSFFVLVMIGLVWLSAWVAREIRLNQRQHAFIDAVTHEMKTPLASLRLYLDTLDRHDPEAERRRHFHGRMREDLDRLDRTIEQVLTAARTEERGRKVGRKSADLREVLEDCVRDVREHHTLPEGSIRVDLTESTAVRGDPGELSVVFRNLLENAVKYSDEPVEVNVRATHRGDGRVDVDISDRGIGIPAGELRKIFQRFYRAGRDVQRTAAGLGLGLFIVRNLVRRQGGRVVARSEGSGEGSRFVVTLRGASPVAERS
jgi:signal transduction histidine kinase